MGSKQQGSPHRWILGSERPSHIGWKSWSYDSVEVQACCWWCLGAEECRDKKKSFSRCTGTLTIALQNRIKGTLFISGSPSEFSVAVNFLFAKYFLGMRIALLCCSSELSQASSSMVWQTLWKSSKIRCIMPDNDFSKPHLYENYFNMVSAVAIQSRQWSSIHDLLFTYSATILVFDS